MADIRIKDLPNELTPSGGDFVAIDLVSTRKTTVTLLTEAGRPAASQAEAEAGTNPTKAMTPLTTAQAIAALGAAQYVPLARTITAGAGLDGGGDLSANRTFDVNFTEVQAFSTKLTNFDGTSLSAGALIFGAGVDTFSVLPIGSNNQFLQIIAGNPTWTNASGSGDVVGPASAINGSIPTYNGTTGKLIQAGNPTMADFLAAATGPMSTIANAAGDLVNDILFSAGAAFSTDATHWPMVGAALTKQLDAAWAVGNNAGGRMSAAAIANTTYHCFQIRRPDTGVVDYGFDVSPTAPTLPTNYTQYRRIASIKRESGTIIPFLQNGDSFKRNGVVDRSSTAAQASVLLTLSVPTGIIVAPLMAFVTQAAASSNVQVLIGSAAEAAANILVINANSIGTENTVDVATPPPNLFTNTSGQILFGTIIGSGACNANSLTTYGWVDTRGK